MLRARQHKITIWVIRTLKTMGNIESLQHLQWLQCTRSLIVLVRLNRLDQGTDQTGHPDNCPKMITTVQGLGQMFRIRRTRFLSDTMATPSRSPIPMHFQPILCQ